ncbi:hypothetical protein BDQ17DRAFT_744982 [Cyathus striatus]|nr:hypothetical protein BDQ17DRAFT_744982 [Cyathus striatus]
MDSIQPHTILVLLEHGRNVTYLHVACLALWVFECLITLDKEVTHIWGSPRWSVVKVLYIIVRYSTYVDASLNIVVQCVPSLSPKACKSLYYAIIWLLVVGMTAAEIILTLRVWAVWQKKKVITIVLTVYLIGITVPSLVLSVFIGRSLTFDLQLDIGRIGGCIVTGGKVELEVATWILLLAYDTIMMLLMLPPAYDAYKRGGKSTLANVVIRDGIIYYVYLFVVSLVNIVVLLKISPDYFSLLSVISRVIHSSLCCRVVLNIRERMGKSSLP